MSDDKEVKRYSVDANERHFGGYEMFETPYGAWVESEDRDRIVAQHEKQFAEYCDRVGDDIQHLNKTIAELRAEVECKRLAKDQAIAAHNKIVTEYNEQRENIIELIKKIADVKTERDELRAEVERLKHAIKQEIQNNDEFGCEFVYIVMAKETIAELRAEVERLKQHKAKYEDDCKRIEYFDGLHEKVTRQEREAEVSKAVIEKLREQRNFWIMEAHVVDSFFVDKTIEANEEALAAIERAEGEKEHE